MLYGAVLRSPVPHARIIEIDTSEAMKAPEVRAVVTGKDFPFTFGGAVKDQPFLAIDRVRYVGEPVAAVAAETELAAYEALKKIRVRYDQLPAVFDPREAVKEGAPLIHPDLGQYRRGGHDIVPGNKYLHDSDLQARRCGRGFCRSRRDLRRRVQRPCRVPYDP